MRRLILALSATMLLSSAQVFGGGVAILRDGHGRHAEEFKTAIDKLGLAPEYFKDTPESLAEFFAKIDSYDAVFFSPLFNYSEDLVAKGVDMAPLGKYIKDGGVVVVTDASYPKLRQLLDPILPGLGAAKTGECTSSQWAVNGYAANVEPVHPIRSFPNAVTDPDSWPHFEETPQGWTTITTCSQGKPVIFFREFGRGAAIVSALRQQNPNAIEDYLAFARMRRSGLSAKAFSMTPLKSGAGTLSISLSAPPPKDSTLVFEVKGPDGQSVSFTTNFVGEAADLGYSIPYRGQITASLYVESKASRQLAFQRVAEMAPLMKVGPNAYRGIISTKRRLDAVRFPVFLAPDTEDLREASLTLSIFDSCSNKVATLSETLPTNDVPGELWVPVPLDKSLTPGGYRIDAILEKPQTPTAQRINAASSAFFEIREPHEGQTVIDDDGTFLINGVPFFPLGIYHTDSGAYAEISDIGFNSQQFWMWGLGYDEYGSPWGLHLAAASKLRCLFEPNHVSPGIFRDCVKRFGSHSAIFMWYVMDEPAEGAEAEMTWRNAVWHEADPDHPTFVASCRPDLFDVHAKYADVLGFDPYVSLDKVIDWCRAVERGPGRHKATVCIPWADQKDLRLARAIAYVAVAHNVRGLIWYCWNQVGGGPQGVGIHNKPESKAYYKELLSEFKCMIPGLTSIVRRPFEEGPVHGIVLGEPTAGGKRFLVLVNTTDAQVEADFAVPELERVGSVKLPFAPKVEKKNENGETVKDKDGKPVMEDVWIRIEGGHVRETLAPYGTKVYNW